MITCGELFEMSSRSGTNARLYFWYLRTEPYHTCRLEVSIISNSVIKTFRSIKNICNVHVMHVVIHLSLQK